MGWMEQEIQKVEEQNRRMRDLNAQLRDKEIQAETQRRQAEAQKVIEAEQEKNALMDLFDQIGVSQLLTEFNQDYFHIGQLTISEKLINEFGTNYKIPKVRLSYKYPVIQEIRKEIYDDERGRDYWEENWSYGYEPKLIGIKTDYSHEVEEEGIEFSYLPASTQIEFIYNSRGGSGRISGTNYKDHGISFSTGSGFIKHESDKLILPYVKNKRELLNNNSIIEESQEGVKNKIAEFWLYKYANRGLTPEDEQARRNREYESRRPLLRQNLSNIEPEPTFKKKWWQKKII